MEAAGPNTPSTAPADRTTQPTRIGQLAALWGVVGYTLLIAKAVWRLWPYVLELFAASGLGWYHVAALIGWVGLMLYSEAYRGFHLAFAPRFAARAVDLARRPTLLRALLAPAFCMSLMSATRKRLIVSWVLVCGIVALVLTLRMIDQPWRGIVDAGVVIGLVTGTLSVFWFFGRAMIGATMPLAPEATDRP